LPFGLNVSTGALEIIGKVPANASEAGSGTYKNRYDFTVTANDNEGGTAQQTITIFAVNVVPTPTDTIAAASVDDGQSSGEIIDMSTHFADTDGDTDHIYSITNTDNTITDLFEIDATTGVISIKDGASIPINASTTSGYTITVQIDDKEGGITTKDVTINVANIAPVAVTDPVTVDVTDAQTAGGILDASGLFTDGDGDDLEFSMTGGPDWLVIDPITGTVSIAEGGVPAGASVNGPITVTIEVDDGEGGITTKDVTITVANIAPVAVTDPVTVDVTDAQTAGSILDASDLFTDGDGDTLEFSMTGGPDWLVIDPIKGAVSIAEGGVPAGASVNGPITVTIQVDDGEGGVTTKDVTIDVANANIKTVGTLPPVTATKDKDITIDTNIFVDPDGDVLTFSAAGLPDGLSIDPTTGMITGKLGQNVVAGTAYVITITVTDSQGSVVSKTFSLNTKSAPSSNSDEVVRNSLPVFSSNVDHTPPAIQVKNVVIDATRALGLGLSSNVQIDASQPIITTVNGLGSLASITEVKSSLPISNLVQDKILNDADRRYIDVALKDPASSGRVFSFNAPD
jgi:hypothetical protein